MSPDACLSGSIFCIQQQCSSNKRVPHDTSTEPQRQEVYLIISTEPQRQEVFSNRTWSVEPRVTQKWGPTSSWVVCRQTAQLKRSSTQHKMEELISTSIRWRSSHLSTRVCCVATSFRKGGFLNCFRLGLPTLREAPRFPSRPAAWFGVSQSL